MTRPRSLREALAAKGRNADGFLTLTDGLPAAAGRFVVSKVAPTGLPDADDLPDALTVEQAHRLLMAAVEARASETGADQGDALAWLIAHDSGCLRCYMELLAAGKRGESTPPLPSVAKAAGDAPPPAADRLESLARDRVKRWDEPYAVAYARVLESDEGRALYAEHYRDQTRKAADPPPAPRSTRKAADPDPVQLTDEQLAALRADHERFMSKARADRDQIAAGLDDLRAGSVGDVEARLDELAKARAARTDEDHAAAYAAVLRSDEGRRLYAARDRGRTSAARIERRRRYPDDAA